QQRSARRCSIGVHLIASTSICLLDRQTGAVLASHQPDQSLIPASTLKVLTTATALALLGEDFRYQTHFEYDGRIEADGTLRGNLYLRGTGDPTLASPQLDATDRATTVLDQLVTALEKAGIRRIEGQVVGDASHFEGAPLARTWPWEDLGNYYADDLSFDPADTRLF
ncbi:MAG: D-alanyl-D-alanine carboxypeptidase/D-alanyl-D-alanine-endopeptidase, partial [Bacteroidota bacterium]